MLLALSVTWATSSCSPRFIADPSASNTSSGANNSDPCPGYILPAKDISVDSGGDNGDTLPGDGLCFDGTGCTLRAAIEEANAQPGTQGIYVSGGVGPTLGGTEISISDNVKIFGEGPTQTLINGGTASRVFNVVAAGLSVEISNLAINDGVDASGAAVNMTGGSLTMHYVTLSGNKANAAEGGAIALGNNFGTLDPTFTMTCSNVTANETNAGGNGGALYIEGQTVTISDTVFDTNTGTAIGGAVYLGSGASASTYNLSRLTFTQNSANVGGAIGIAAGGVTVAATIVSSTFDANGGTAGAVVLYTDNAVTTNFYNNTVSSNVNTGGFGDVFQINTGGVFNIANNIVWGNSGPATACSIAGTMNSLGKNIYDDFTSCTIHATDFTTDPVLGALLANGSATSFTRAIAAGSSADNAANALYCPSTDNRNFTRAATCDIGAFERQ